MSAAATGGTPRNIILLSDGTGAGSLSFNKSNVWRIFTTLDLGPGSDQIAFYDDGVGTSGIKWLRALGGGFGWGLSRNVRQMYEFLCRHYQPGDRIYIFGFSRGAFTARVLAHFIGVCGILDRTGTAPNGYRMETERGFQRGVKQAYKSYRRRYWDNAWMLQRWVGSVFRAIRNLMPRWRVLPADQFKKRYGLPPRADGGRVIEFLGVWDTVDAVGLPVDELSDLLDKFVYPYKFPNQKFSQHVERAAHALAVDDERETFHPVLWDETDPADAARVNQVWFAGMHSNVGGGYPEDNLGYITLDWMIGEACNDRPGVPGLKLNEQKLDVFRHRGEPLGKLYDSRRGAATYYRYKPRYIADLCHQKQKVSKGAVIHRAEISILEPKVHHSVLDRIADSKAGYAPVGLPKNFAVVDSEGNVDSFIDPTFGGEGAHGTPLGPDGQRAALLERTRDHVFWRRFAYFSLLLLTFVFVAMPVYQPPIPGWEPSASEFESAGSQISAAVFNQLSGITPGFATYWTDAWIQAGWWFIALAVIGAGIFIWSYWIEGNLRELTEGAFWHVKGSTLPRSIRKKGVFERLAHAVRTSGAGKRIGVFSGRFAVPFAFAVLGVCLVLGGAYRLIVHYPFVKGGVCRLEDGVSVSPAPANVFSTKEPCFNTRQELRKRKRYRVTLTGWERKGEDVAGGSPSPHWSDAGYAATYKGLDGFRSLVEPAFLFGLPLRRHLGYPWFTLVGEIGTDSGVVFPLNQEEFVFQPKDTGPLYLYVNDAIWSWPFSSDWQRFYENNTGEARVVFGRQGETLPPPEPGVPTITFIELRD